eukprot:9006843-Ditylum_brightwellii.AAC.1
MELLQEVDMVCNREEKTLVQHAGPLFGKESLFRSEAYGVLSVQSYEYDYSFHTLDPDRDIIAQICSVLQSSLIEEDFIHVKGHQDDEMPYE